MVIQSELRILVVDDNPNIYQDLVKVLTTEKKANNELEELQSKLSLNGKAHPVLPRFRIDSASQGEEGVGLIEASVRSGDPYAVAFVDIRMPPGIDGIETIEKIWKIDPDVQVVICTAYSDYSWEKMVEKLGDHENLLVLKKPFDAVAVRQLSMALTKKWLLLHESRDHTEDLEKKIHERTKSLEFQATHDALTGLPNRLGLMTFLEELIQRSESSMSLFAILFLDLDRFKLINDSFSHFAGDQMLVQFSKRILNNLRQIDYLARIGGDEFIIVLSDFKNSDFVTAIVTKLLDKLNETFSIENHDIVALASIGVCIFPYNGKTAEELIKNADVAMYRAKESGGNQFQFYNQEIDRKNIQRLILEAELHQAIRNNEFYLCYQPQYDYGSEKLLSVEALIRWHHPKKGDLLPIDFVPLAEEVWLLVLIGEWVLRTACTQIKKWQDQGLPLIKVAVNVTTHQFMQPNFVQMVENILTEIQLEPKYLELELTENIMIRDRDAVEKLPKLKALGVSLAIDDFGTGYSSLSYLKKFPLDKLKIDRSFIKNIQLNKCDEVIIQAIISMAKSLNLEVTAEGVETKEQLDFLKKNACMEIQGFYFSKPLNSSDCEKLLKKQT